jgi:hypothetical protein
MACVRHLCQETPGSVAWIASIRPGCASEVTSLTATGDERAPEEEPGGAVLAGDEVEAERLAEALAVDGDGVDDAGVDRPAALAALDLERVEDEVGKGRAVERAGAEVLDDRIERLGQPGNLTLAHVLDAELPDELLHPARGDAGEVGVGDHGDERLLRPPAWLQKPVK